MFQCQINGLEHFGTRPYWQCGSGTALEHERGEFRRKRLFGTRPCNKTTRRAQVFIHRHLWTSGSFLWTSPWSFFPQSLLTSVGNQTAFCPHEVWAGLVIHGVTIFPPTKARAGGAKRQRRGDRAFGMGKHSSVDNPDRPQDRDPVDGKPRGSPPRPKTFEEMQREKPKPMRILADVLSSSVRTSVFMGCYTMNAGLMISAEVQ